MCSGSPDGVDHLLTIEEGIEGLRRDVRQGLPRDLLVAGVQTACRLRNQLEAAITELVGGCQLLDVL